jgi:lipopolysaccharide assembly protein A
MAIGYLLVAVIAAALAVFALQNGAPVAVEFAIWKLEGVPLAGVILGAFGAGLIIAAVPLTIQRWRARSQLRRLEARLRTLEAQQQQQQQRPLTPPREGSL